MPYIDPTTGEARILEQRDPIARAQEKKVIAAARVYKAAAEEVSAMYAMYGHDDRGQILLAKTDPDFKEWSRALAAKATAEAAWKKEAYRHGGMFVPLKDPKFVDPNDPRSEEEKAEDQVW